MGTVTKKLHIIMKSIHQTCLDAAEQYGSLGNYVVGANIAGFVKVVYAMLDQGIGQFRDKRTPI
jgi:glutamate dehydrogenase (NADP+)